jgi:FkbM family methyltransferase
VNALPRRLVRALANQLVGGELRVVRVVSGAARGARLELDLSTEKAYWLGYYERNVQRVLRENVSAGDVVYDVGAHIGFFSVCAARLGAKVFAVEPVAASAVRLRRNAALNDADIEVVAAAAWDETASVELVAGEWPQQARTAAGEGIPTITLDKLAERDRPPTLIKLDVEGAEAQVLRGAQRILADQRPLVVCELHGEQAQRDVLELLDGYRIEQLPGESRLVAGP